MYKAVTDIQLKCQSLSDGAMPCALLLGELFDRGVCGVGSGDGGGVGLGWTWVPGFSLYVHDVISRWMDLA